MTPEEKKRLEILNAQKESNKTGKLINRLEQERLSLLNKQTEAQKKQNELAKKNFDLGAKAQKLQSSFAQRQKKLEDDVNGSILTRLKNIAKGNLLEGFRPSLAKKNLDLTTKANTLSKTILKTESLTNSKKVALQDLTKDILEGNVKNKKEIYLRAKALGVEKNVRKDLSQQAGELYDSQENTSKSTKKTNQRMALLGKSAGVVGLVLGTVYKLATNFSAKIDEVGKTFGFLTNKNKDFRNDLLLAGNNAIMIGKNLGDVLAVTAQLSSEFGISLTEADDLASKVLDTAVATGLSNDEATKLFGTFMQLGDLTAKQAEDLIEGTAQLAAQRGVAPTAVLQDMAGSAEEIASFTRGTGENIAEAAVQARQLGLSLSTTAKISDSLLDFQTSIANEVEASVMIGRRLNFQRARQLSLEGDIAGATKEVVKQLGSEEELNRLQVPQRRSIAKSIGVSVAEMTKLVRGQEKLTLSTALAGKNFDDLVGTDSLSTLTQITNSVKSVAASLLDVFGGPLADMLSQFTGENGLENIKKQLVAIANIAIDSFNAGRSFLNTFRFDVELAKKFRLDDSGNLKRDLEVNDFRGGRGAITTMAGPAGVFRLNPMDSVMATTNPIQVNDFQSGPAGSMGGTQKIEVTGQLTGTRGALMATIESPLG